MLNNNNRITSHREQLYDVPMTRVFIQDEEMPLEFVNVFYESWPIPINAPDAFVMAFETGLNLVGLSVALNVHTQMSIGDPTMEWWGHLHPFDWYTEDNNYTRQGKNLFNSLIDLRYPYYEYLYNMAQLDMGRVGLHQQIIMREELFETVLYMNQALLDILMTLSKYRELFHVEFSLNDPAFGPIPFNACSFKKQKEDDTQFFITEPGSWYGMNWNIFDPQRFESFLSGNFILYDETVSDKEIQEIHGIAYNDVAFDSIVFEWDSDGVSNVTLDLESRINRSTNNVIVTFENIQKPEMSFSSLVGVKDWVNNNYMNVRTKKLLFKGEKNIGLYYEAMSYFIIQSLITYRLQQQMKSRVDSEQDEQMFRLFPSFYGFDRMEWNNFVDYYVRDYNYGNYVTSSMSQFYEEIITESTLAQ